jgi:hypothetical protein
MCAIDIVPCGAFTGDIRGYITDKRVLAYILRDDESYVFQYVFKACAETRQASFKAFTKMIKACFVDHAQSINQLRFKDKHRLKMLNPYTLRGDYIKLYGRILSKKIINRIFPSQKRLKKINDLIVKSNYLKQALR